ncbi:MAG: hypothetical protein ACLUE1_03445 [Adlercreutzia equolifaciens]
MTHRPSGAPHQIAEYVEATGAPALHGGAPRAAAGLRRHRLRARLQDDGIDGQPVSVTPKPEGGAGRRLADADPAPLLAAVLDGGLSYRRPGLRRPTRSRWHPAGMSVTTASVRDAGEYASSVRIVADEVEVAATLFGTEHTPRIISLMGYKIDIAPATTSLVFEYVDAPGRIGVIGTILGDAAANITTMQIGTKPEESCALVYMNVEGDVSEAVLDRLRGAIDLRNLWKITL